MQILKQFSKLRYYEMGTLDGDFSSAWQFSKFGPSPENLSEDLGPLSWWRKHGGYADSDACNALKGKEKEMPVLR